MRVAGVIFDLDGTIADTFAICFATFRNALAAVAGPSLTDAEIQARFGPSEDGMFQRVVPQRWHEAFAAYLSEYERHLPQCAVFPGVTAALASLRERGVPRALVTGKARPTALMSLQAFGLAGAFEPVETGSPAGVVKAAAITRVIARWHVPPREVIYVGDAVADMRAAHEAGVVAVAAAWAPTASADELGALAPHALFTDAGEFAAWLARG
ncbi:MAG TPA: HAD hydrolase-like protein [Methylomirabilota bacterium]|nr:HAD hydrolase-like protein [Methylomirabilota bacterium]